MNNEDTIKNLETIYKNIFSQYLIENTSIKEYDTDINNNTLEIGAATKEPLPYKIKDTSYFYLCNKFFTEKLSQEDKNILKKYEEETINTLNDELNDLIKRTCKDMIFVEYIYGNNNNCNFQIAYGPAIPKYFVKNDSLAIKVIYRDSAKSKLNYMKHIISQSDYLDKISKKLSEEIQNIGLPNKIIVVIENTMWGVLNG